MSFSSRRRNYLLTPHRRDGLIEWMKSMLQHSFVLDALATTAADTFSHFEILIEEHRRLGDSPQPSRLQQLVPTIGTFHTGLPLRDAFVAYNKKHQLTQRKHIQISFNEIRHILNLAQIMAMRSPDRTPPQTSTSVFLESSEKLADNDDDDTSNNNYNETKSSSSDLLVPGEQLNGPKLISFDGDQTLYSDGANFEENPKLANYLYLLLRHGVYVAIVTAAGYEYKVEKYEFRLSGLLKYFEKRGLTPQQCERFYLFGGECNYLLRLGRDYHLHPVQEDGPGGWCNASKHLKDGPATWSEASVQGLLDVAEANAQTTVKELNLRGRVLRKRRAVGLVPLPDKEITRESLDETILRVHEKLHNMNDGKGPGLPYCAFNGGTDAWVDVGNKRVGVQVLQTFLGVTPSETLHIGDQFLNTGNDYAARATAPCIWIINPKETTYILKSILQLAGVSHLPPAIADETLLDPSQSLDWKEVERRQKAAAQMDVYTGELINKQESSPSAEIKRP